MAYSYNLPNILVWLFHILFGVFLVYLGFKIKKNDEPIDEEFGTTLVLIGALGVAFHSNLWYTRNL